MFRLPGPARAKALAAGLLAAWLIAACGDDQAASRSALMQQIDAEIAAFDAAKTTIETNNRDANWREEVWLQDSIPKMLGKRAMYNIVDDSLAFLRFERLEEQIRSYSDAHNAVFYQYGQRLERAREWYDRLGNEEQALVDVRLAWADFNNSLDELRAAEQKIAGDCAAWNDSMLAFTREMYKRWPPRRRNREEADSLRAARNDSL